MVLMKVSPESVGVGGTMRGQTVVSLKRRE